MTNHLKKDNSLAYLLASKIIQNKNIKLDLDKVQTNIVTIDVSPSGYSAQKFEEELSHYGLKVKSMSEKFVRMTLYNDITKEDALKAANIFNSYCEKL